VTGSRHGLDGNGHVPDPESLAEGDGPDDDSPLDDAEAAAAAALADAAVDESLDERVEAVIADLGAADRRRAADGVAYAVNGRVFAVLGEDRLEVALDALVAKAALRTPDTSASPRGPGWIVFSPAVIDRFALDRADAWVRSAHRRAAVAG
jgi:hypothetical protein